LFFRLTAGSVLKLRDAVITGIGLVSPIGVGRAAFWKSLLGGVSGVRELADVGEQSLASKIGGQIVDFEPKEYVRPRKSLKVMSREIQFAYAAADLAWQDAGLSELPVDPDRVGVICGCETLYSDITELVPVYKSCMPERNGNFDFSRWGQQGMGELFPLWMLKFLPNMPACHISIARDARGPCNSIISGDVSSLLAVIEGVIAVRRSLADVMLVGGVGSRLQPTALAWRGDAFVSRRNGDPAAACRPFDARRDGMVNAEGAAFLVLECAAHARRRGAEPLARFVGSGNCFEAPGAEGLVSGKAIRRSIAQAAGCAGWGEKDVGHVNAHGLSTVEDDRVEAQAIRAALGDVPVVAPKSYFGNVGAGTGAMELAVSVLALHAGVVPPTLNYEEPDPACPVRVIAGEPQPVRVPTAIALNQTRLGQAVAVAIAR
jgi:3-oxoacyl-[acyl-carrier-protein] synthase II